MITEIKETISKHKIAKSRLSLLSNKQKTLKNDQDFCEVVNKASRKINSPMLIAILHQEYESTCTELNIIKAKEAISTHSEDEFLKNFKNTKKYLIKRQAWVGNLCADFLVVGAGLRKDDYIRGFQFKGLVFEIDGSSHDHPVKQKKDMFNVEQLMKLKILPIRIKNNDAHQSKSLTVFKSISPISTHERRRLIKKIELLTCAYHLSDAKWDTFIALIPKYRKTRDKTEKFKYETL